MLQNRSQRRGAVIGLASMGAGLALLVGAISSPATADGDHDGPEEVDGNPSCADLGFTNGFKIEATGEFPDEGTYDVDSPGVETEGDAAGFEVTISYDSDDPITFSFEANTPVNAVIVKAGDGALVYTYDPAVTSASGLESPKDDSISHITFCFDEEPPPPEEPPGEEPPGEEPPGEEPPGEEPPGEEPTDEAPPATPIPGEPDFTG